MISKKDLELLKNAGWVIITKSPLKIGLVISQVGYIEIEGEDKVKIEIKMLKDLNKIKKYLERKSNGKNKKQ